MRAQKDYGRCLKKTDFDGLSCYSFSNGNIGYLLVNCAPKNVGNARHSVARVVNLICATV